MKAKLYTFSTCPYCTAAIQLLEEKNIPFENIDVTNNPELRNDISVSVGNFPTVPMIFLDDRFIGGFSELQALDI